jgi:hypothetical protein
MSRGPNLCPTCNTLCTPQEARKFKSQQAKIAELENALAAASGTIAAMREGGADDEGMAEFWATEGGFYGSGGW